MSKVDISVTEDVLLNTRQAAHYLGGMSSKTLERYRITGKLNIPFLKFPGRNGPVRYRKSDLDEFLRKSMRSSTSEYVR